MKIRGFDVPAEVVDEVMKRMDIGVFSPDSLVPIVRAFMPQAQDGSALLAKQIAGGIIWRESEAGTIRNLHGEFWERC